MKHARGTRELRLSFVSTPTLVYYATRSGGTTLDTGEGGGNPFASALIEVATEPTLQLRNLGTRLRKLTIAKSHGHQVVDYVGDTGLPTWRFVEDLSLRREQRTALVLVVSDYSNFSSGMSLIGAARDERRIGAMLAQHGFSVDQGIGPQRHDIIKALVSFKRRSQRSDIGIIYSTGHGVELDGIVYLLPGDYPMHDGFGSVQVKRHAVSVTQMVHAAHARGQNIVFFAGCRRYAQHNGVAPPNHANATDSESRC
jgi:hypothetical protein